MDTERELTATAATNLGRFDALLKGESDAVYDRALLARDNWIVVPTVGSIIAGWLLAVPRQAVLNFRDWAIAGGQAPLAILDEVRGHLGLGSREIIWFEHGPSAAHTPVGCGLDHAHIHILIRPPFSFERFVATARAHSDLKWQEASPAPAYGTLNDRASYLIAGSGEQAVSATDVESAGSQFFRRVIATMCDSPSDWDYRRHAHLKHVQATIATFRGLESAAISER